MRSCWQRARAIAVISLFCFFCFVFVKVLHNFLLQQVLSPFFKACNHPILVAKDYKNDMDAVDPKGVAKGQDDKDADGDDLATAFGQMGVTRKCQMCTTE